MSQLSDSLFTSTCTHGKWDCTKKKCPGTCTIYGSGHYSTFDKQRFGFSGDCSYMALQVSNVALCLPNFFLLILVICSQSDTLTWTVWYILILLVSTALKNKCGNKTGTFHVITENVPCGTTGTTCSKAVRIVLGVRTSI